jgi:hypothetical protein
LATTQLNTFSTAGYTTYTIPAWARKLDVIALGGGGSGYNGQTANNNGGGGGAGSYATKTLIRGTDFGWDDTSLTVYVGAGGTSAVPRTSSTNGANSALCVEYGATGPGVTVASATGTITGSWTHTPASSDNHVTVFVSVAGAGIGYASATRTVTYGGVAMTSRIAVNANSTVGNGWVEVFTAPIIIGAGAQTVVATVTASGIALTNLKANSVSHSNVDSTGTVPSAITGTDAAPYVFSLGGATNNGFHVASAILAKASTITSYTSGTVSRYASNTAPAFAVTSGGGIDETFGPGANLAAATPWASVGVYLNSATFGAGGAAGANQGTTEQGSSPGNLTYNAQTYVGGAAAGTNNQATAVQGNAPGGGGSGTNGNLFSNGNVGGNGGTGRVWVFAYEQFADISSTITATRTTVGLRNTLVSSSTVAVTASFSAVPFTSIGLTTSSAITATTSSVGLRDIPSSTTQSETATITSAGLRNALVDSSAPVNIQTLTTAKQISNIQTSLATNTTVSSSGVIAGLLSSSQPTTVGVSSAVLWAALLSAPQAINFSFSIATLRNIPTAISLPVTATGNTIANIAVPVSSSTPVTDTVGSAAQLLAVGTAPRAISCTLTADSLRLAKVDAAQPITATISSIARWAAYVASNSTAVTSTSSPLAQNSTVINATTLPGFPYYFPMRFGTTFKASFSGFITRLQFADVPLIITADRPSNAVGAIRISSSLAVTATNTGLLNSNQPTQSTTLAITNSQSGAALRNVFASASLSVIVTTSSANAFAGFVDTAIDVVITDSTSATEILFGVMGQSQIITANRPADALRNARTDAALTVTANRASNVNWYANFDSINTTITPAQNGYAVYSTPIVATTLPGFPYYFPMRFGTTFRVGISSTVANRFTSPTNPTAVVASISAAPKAGWSATPSLAVNFGGSQNANIVAAIASSTVTSVSSTPDSRKNIFISATNTAITDTVSGSSLAGFYGAASLAALPAQTAVNSLATVISSQTSTTSFSSPSSLKDVRVASSLLVSGTLTTVANYSTTASSSRLITSAFTSNLNESTVINATTLPGFPYYLPMRFGTTFKASLTLSMAISYQIAAALYVFSESTPKLNARWSTAASLATTFVTDYKGFPYQLPFKLGALDTKANNAALSQASQTITPNTSSSDRMTALLDGSLSVSFGRSSSLLRDVRVDSSAPTTATASVDQKLGGFISSTTPVSFTTTIVGRGGFSFSAPTSITSYPTVTGLRNALVDSGLIVSVAVNGASTSSLYNTTSLTVSASAPTEGKLSGLISSQTSIAFANTPSSLRIANVASSLLVSGTFASVGNYSTTLTGSLATTALRATELKESTTIGATTLPGFPYYLPMRFGVTIRASTSSVLSNNNTASASLEAAANTNQSLGNRGTVAASLATIVTTNYPGFPYTLPFRVGNLNTTATTSVSLQATQIIAPNASASGKMSALLTGNLSVSSVLSSIVFWSAKFASSLLVSPSVSAAQSLSGILSASVPVSFTANTTGLARIIFDGSLAVTSPPTSSGLRNALVDSNIAITANVTGDNTLAGFLDGTLPLVITDSTSATEILAAVSYGSQALSAVATADIKRQAYCSTTLSVASNPSANTSWQASFGSSLTVSALCSPLLKYSAEINATTLPGFPYYLPMRFGVAIRASAPSALSNNNIASASLAVAAGTNQSVGTRTVISTGLAVNFVTNYSGFPYTLPFRVGALNTTANTSLLLQASQTISPNASSSDRMAALLSGSLSISSGISSSSLRNARVDSSLPVAISTDAAEKLSGISASDSSIYSTTTSSVRSASTLTSSLTASPSATAAGLRNVLVDSGLLATADPSGDKALAGLLYGLSLTVSAAVSASERLAAVGDSSKTFSVLASADTARKIYSDINLSISSALTSVINQQESCAASLALTSLGTSQLRESTTISATTLPGFPYYLPMRFGVAMRVSTSAALANTNVASASLTITANGNHSVSYGTSISTSLTANLVTNYHGFPYILPFLLGRLNLQANVSNGVSSSTPISFLPSASVVQNFSASASRQINASTSVNIVDKETISAHLNAKAALVPCFPYDLPILLSSAINAQASMSRNQELDAALQITSLRETKLGHSIRAASSLSVSFVTDYPGMPYTLPFLLGNLNTSATLKKSIQASSGISTTISSALSLGQSLSATRQITNSGQSSASHGSPIYTHLNVKDALVPCFPYDLPIILSSEPNARASALRNARVDSSLTANAARPTNIGILVKGDVSLAVSAITNYQCLPYTLPYLLGHLDTRMSLSRSIQSSLSGLATDTANFSQNQKLDVARQITAQLSSSGSRDALVSASLKVKATTVPCFPYVLPFELNTVSYQQASATRLTRASANTMAVGVRGMDPTFMPGFPYMLPFRIGVAAPSPRMSLGTKASSSTSIITVLDAEMLRRLGAFSDETITATTQSGLSGKITFATHLAVGTTQTPVLNVFPYELPYQFATYRSEPPRATLVVSSRVTSTLVITARTYGFPYQLPIKLGPVNSVRLSRSVSAQTTVNITTSAFLAETGATLVSLPVSVDNPASAKGKLYAYVNSLPGFPYTLPLLLRGSSFNVTASRPAVLGFVRLGSAQVSTTVSTGSPSTLANFSANPALSVVARTTANANFVAAIASSFATTVIITALAKYRINLAAPLTVSPISFVRMNFRTTISAPLDAQNNPTAYATLDTVLSADLPVSTTADTILSEVSKNAASLFVNATGSVSGLRDTKASTNTSVSATFSAGMFLAARASGPLPVIVSTEVRTKEYGLALASLEVSSNPAANLLQRSAISAPSDISFNTNTIENQYQRFSTTVNSLADLLAVVSKDQKIGSPTSETLAGIFSSMLRSISATAQPVIVASRPTEFHGDFICGTEMGITAQPSIWFSWAAHADIPLDVTAGLDISIRRGQFIVSVGTAVSAEVAASAEPYHAAGTFLPFFYAGSNFV